MGAALKTGNGTSWSVATSSNVGTNYNNLYGVSCKEETCQSAGDFENTVANPVAYNTLAESWNGTSWSTETSPNVSPYNNALLAASCATAANCMEVGHYVSQYVNSVGTI